MEGRGSSLLLSEQDLARAYEKVNGYLLCREMGWSWEELERTPADIVDDFLYIMIHGKRQAANRD